MDDLLGELNKRFNDFIKQKDGIRFFLGLTKYFRFIENNYPLNDIARHIFSSTSTPSVVSNIKGLYERVIFNKPISEGFFGISPESLGGSGLSAFHSLLVENLKKLGFSDKQKIFLYTKKGDQRICLAGENHICVSFKGEATKRFKIVHPILFRTETGHSAREIAELLDKDEKDRIVQDNIKKEIKAIDIKCQKELEIKRDLITKTKQGGKNIYFLNRKHFTFEPKK